MIQRIYFFKEIQSLLVHFIFMFFYENPAGVGRKYHNTHKISPLGDSDTIKLEET